MKKNILKKIKRRINIQLIWFSKYRKYYKECKKRIILINAPTHGNLGDQALTLAEYNMFTEILPEYEIVEIPTPIQHAISARKLKKVIKDHVIIIQAGGFLGTLWMNEEKALRKILSEFPNNTIVIMPQTITYSDDDIGKKEKSVSKALYKNCKNLYLFVRNEDSLAEGYELVGKQNTFLAPDMVVGYLPYDSSKIVKEYKCLFCVRNDKEKSVNIDTLDKIRQLVEAKLNGISILHTDTVIPYSVTADQRNCKVKHILDEFASAQLIITDRLHGMLFAAISGTPCVAINNSNGKVKGVNNWIKEVPYVRFIDDINDFEAALSNVLAYKNNIYPTNLMKTKYKELRNILKEVILNKR